MVLLALLSLPAHAQQLLVLNKTDNTLAIVDAASLKVVATVPTGMGPHEVAVSNDGKTAYVANYGSGPQPGSTLSVVDLGTLKAREVSLGALQRPHGITESGGKIYFTAEGSRLVARLDPASERVDWLMGTGQLVTHMVVVAPKLNKLYTANIGSDTVTVVNLSASGPQQMKQIATGKGPEGMDLSPDGKELWVGPRGDGGLAIIDTGTDTIKQTLQVGKAPIRVKFTPDGKRVLVSDAAAGEVIIFDPAARKEVKRIPVGEAPVGIQVTPDGKRAFVAATRADKVFEIDLEKLDVGRSLSPGREPDGMAWAK
ncbi:MAG TPA: cytochrome D1 domain-containing protein [Terriglobales bacterium]|nr:cytochrome D1 domain-containing protein [Terriglobales bacterium]